MDVYGRNIDLVYGVIIQLATGVTTLYGMRWWLSSSVLTLDLTGRYPGYRMNSWSNQPTVFRVDFLEGP